MISVISYFLMFTISWGVIKFTDDDLNNVSLREWIMFAIMIYSGIALIRKLLQMYKESGGY